MSDCKHEWVVSDESSMWCDNDCRGTEGGDDQTLDSYEIASYIFILETALQRIKEISNIVCAEEEDAMAFELGSIASDALKESGDD